MDEPGGHYAKWNKPDEKTNSAWSHLNAEPKNAELIEAESRTMIVRGWKLEEIEEYWAKDTNFQL